MHDLAPPTAPPATVRWPATTHRAFSGGLKRVFDVSVASALLVVLAPVMALVAAAVAATMGRPVLFVQRRPGLGGELFPMLKFRTMTNAPSGTGTEQDGARTTRLGRFLRSTSLDELPELLNVVRGDMSLVGPRPLLADYLERYTPTQARRHEVRPGVTGLAQTTGRKGLSWEETFALDVWYVDHRSLLLDLRILGRTALRVLTDVSATADEDLARPDFGVERDEPEVVITIPDPPEEQSPRPGADTIASPLRVLDPADLLAWKRARGIHVVEHAGHHWERHHGGFYQPLHVLDRMRLEDVTRPSPLAWGFRAALVPDDAADANAHIPLRMMADVSSFDPASWSSSRRNQLRRSRKRSSITVLDDASVLHRHGLRIVRSCAERIGFTAPTEAAYHADLDRYLTRAPLVLLATTTAGAPIGYLTAFAVGSTAYVDRVFVHSDALNTYASVGLLHDLLAICRRTPGIREVVHGQERRENPSLGRFKEGLGFPLVTVPSFVHLPSTLGAVIHRRRPHAYHRLTGRT